MGLPQDTYSLFRKTSRIMFFDLGPRFAIVLTDAFKDDVRAMRGTTDAVAAPTKAA